MSGNTGNIVHGAAVITCPHGGRADIHAAASPRASLDGWPLLTVADAITISGCPHVVDDEPRPCVTIRWDLAGVGSVLAGAHAGARAGSGGMSAAAGTRGAGGIGGDGAGADGASVLIDGIPAVLDVSAGQCLDAAQRPQGPPRISGAASGVEVAR